MNKKDKKQHNRSQKGLINPKNVREFKVYVETSLLAFLKFKYPDTPLKNLKSMLSHHQVAANGVVTSRFDFPLVPEDEVTISKTSINTKKVEKPKILYEDEDIIAIDKPSGLLSLATEREKGRTAYRLISDYLTSKKSRSRPYVVHRLDEDTSGVLVFAKNYLTREALQNKWSKIVSFRGYYAIVEGNTQQEGSLKDYLARNNFNLSYVTKDSKKGKLAITHYKKIKDIDGFSLLDVNIKTGRSNQIRVQLGHIGHHVIGDDKYGEPADPLGRLGLHAYQLDFINPLNGKNYSIKSPMPKNFKKMFFESREKQRKIAYTPPKRSQKESKKALKIKKAKSSKKFKQFKKERK